MRAGRWILAGLLLGALLELAILIEVGSLIGAGPTIILVLLGVLAGFVVVRREGSAAFRRLGDLVQAGRMPTTEFQDTGIVVLAGVLLMVPGFLTDVAGLLLLLPATRPIARRPLRRLAVRGPAGRPRFAATRSGPVITGVVIDEPPQPRPVITGEAVEHPGGPSPR